MPITPRVFLPLLLLFCLAPALSMAQEAAPGTPITATGVVQRVMAIGGETSGWALALEQPLTLEGQRVTRLDLEPGDCELGRWENQRVEVSGLVDRRQGVERSYWVLRVLRVSALRPKASPP